MDMTDLNDLAPLSKRLNAATDELNRTLESIQQKLNDLALGVEVFLDRKGDELEAVVLDGNTDDDDVRVVRLHELGYGRLGDGWALLVRTADYQQRRDRDGDWDYTDNLGSGSDIKPLLRSARHIRVKAVDLLPKLVDRLRAEASNVIAAVEKAKKIAESLR
jgi:hypothetical protein